MHTKGQWEIEWNPIDGVEARISSKCQQPIATMYTQTNGRDNARLIAKAPEMAARLKELVDFLDGAMDCQTSDEVGDFITNNADIADDARALLREFKEVTP